MKNKFLLISLLLIVSTGKSQIYCFPGATWYYSDWAFGISGYSKLFYQGDTMINSTTCKKVTKFYEYNQIIQNYSGYSSPYFVYEQNSVAYIYNNKYGYNKFDTLFDINAQIGNKWRMPIVDTACHDTTHFVNVLNIGTKSMQGYSLKWLYVKFGPLNTSGLFKYDTIYERIGFRFDDFDFSRCYNLADESPHGSLRCYSDSTFGSYIVNPNIACNYYPSSVNESANEINFSIFPNPANTSLNIRCESQIKSKIYFELYNLLGEKIMSEQLQMNENQKTIDISIINSGTYVYQMHSENKLLQTNKIVIIK